MEGETVSGATLVDLPSSPKPPSSPVEEKVNVSPKTERQSPEPNCAICLGKSENKSFTDSCLHQFCFSCLLEWSRVKPECPLCKQSFKSIIHNVRSNEDYDQYHLRPPEPAMPIWNVNVNIDADIRRFRYRTTLVDRYRSEERVIQNWASPIVLSSPTSIPSHSGGLPHFRRRVATCEFRRSIYEQNLWVNPLSDITGRYRDCSPEFYRLNPAQVHRLVPWLNRELGVLINNSGSRVHAMDLILHLLPRVPIHSMEFRSQIYPFTGANTSHFLHELYEFARSPYDMIGFDQSAEYVHISSYPIEVPSSSSDDDSDSDVIVLSSDPSIASTSTSSRTGLQTSPEDLSTAGPSGADNIMLMVSRELRNLQSDGDSSSTATTVDVTNESNQTEGRSDPEDCMIVGYVKPRHERTPEIITLDSDQDDVIEDGEVPAPTRTSHGFGYEDQMFPFFFSTTSSSSSSDSDYRPNQRRKVTRRKISSVSRRTKGSNSKLPLKKRHRCLSSSSSSSSSSPCEHLKKTRKPRQIISSDSSDDEDSVKSGRKREIWRIMENQRLTTCREPATDHDYSVDYSNNYDAPYTSSEIAAFTDENRPKLRSIIITRSATDPQQDHSLSPIASTSRRSSNHKRRHKSSGKKDEKKKRKVKKRSSSSSTSPSHNSKSKRKKKKRSRKRNSSTESSS